MRSMSEPSSMRQTSLTSKTTLTRSSFSAFDPLRISQTSRFPMCIFTKRENVSSSKRPKGDQSNKSSTAQYPSAHDASQKPPPPSFFPVTASTSAPAYAANIPATTSLQSTHSKTCISELHKLAVVHQKLKISERQKKKSSLDAKKKQMEEAQKALGVLPNTTLMERLEKEKRDHQAPPQENSVRARSKIGDISFSLMGKKATGSMKDDTQFPNKNSMTNDPEELVEEGKDDLDAEPNSENFMYNNLEIQYTVHDMIRTLDKGNVQDATGDCLIPDGSEVPKWNPLIEVEALQKREGFDCLTLRRNTFVSATTCFRNDNDLMSAKTQKTAREKSTTVFLEAIRSLRQMRAEMEGEPSLPTLVTPKSETMSSGRTQRTAEDEDKKFSARGRRSPITAQSSQSKSRTKTSPLKKGHSVQ
ncbi:hypothetical protein L596_015447 [Steinernema carpocapsae]|uniref:Uncharacterized protein n=1 Tax=Steinernema carpocapsae TaxID=34508 RepID=A0A4U5NFX0_STECR|nr:hypothetical protein L596_015447 [Steinernema carpocapsae]